jgi:1,4-alpha-glucan branching enzyme
MVKVVARNAQISDLLWSHERGYAGAAPYRDFHAVDHAYGLKLSAVGEKSRQDKPVYDPQSAQIQVEVDARNFVRELRTSFDVQREQGTESPTVVIGIDTELLGHWWHEGVAWFERVIELLPESRINTSTLEQVTSTARTSIHLSASSWGSGKDWSVWTGNPVRDIAMMNSQSQEYVLDLIERNTCTSAHLNQLMLQLSSDWAFMVTRETAAQYARDRVLTHMHQLKSGVDPDAPFPLISFSASRVRTRTDSA